MTGIGKRISVKSVNGRQIIVRQSWIANSSVRTAVRILVHPNIRFIREREREGARCDNCLAVELTPEEHFSLPVNRQNNCSLPFSIEAMSLSLFLSLGLCECLYVSLATQLTNMSNERVNKNHNQPTLKLACVFCPV